LEEELKSGNSNVFDLIFLALASCHSVKIMDDKSLLGWSSEEIAIIEGLRRLGWTLSSIPGGGLLISYRDTLRRNCGIRVLRVIPFSHDRMRMSVVVEVDQGQRYVFMKGAPERIKLLCSESSGREAEAWDEYEGFGLRCLAVSYKSIGDSYESMTVEELESDHILLGTLGIEDALQHDAQLTMDLLSDAGLKLWVATGDAARNTLVIASRLRIVRSEEHVLHLTVDHLLHLKDMNYQDGGFIERASLVRENSFSVVIDCWNSKAIGTALEDKEFVGALLNARSVIFYRCLPDTKTRVAVALQNIGKRVLGVGDGANDSGLLRTADVGVGILGKAGARAFAGCDFAIPAFRNLGRLVLVHGHNAFHRSVLAVNFSFYKAVMFGACQIVYQFWTDFTGQSFFDSFSITIYNNLWTLLPMISLIFEKDVSESFLYRLSFLHRKLRNPLTITPSNLTWFFSGVYQGVISMVIVWVLTGEAFLSNAGKDFGVRYLSIVVYIGLVFMCTFYMAYQTNTFTYYSLLLVVGNLNLLIALTAALQSQNFLSKMLDGWTGFYGECFNQPRTLVILLTMILASVTPSWVGLTIMAEYQASESRQVMERETIAVKSDEPLFFNPAKSR
jgi:phospholipid-translocating ATPase